MKKILFGFLFVALTLNTALAYRDIPESSRFRESIDFFIDKGVLDGKGFFRPDSDVPQMMFWEVIIGDTAFNADKTGLDGAIPKGIDPKSREAEFLREAVRRGFIDPEKPFDPLAPIKRSEAIKHIVATKGILVSDQTSSRFRKISSGVSRLAKYYPHIEAAYASKIVTNFDIDPFQPRENLSRRNLITWLHNWHKNGQLKETGFNKPFTSEIQFPYQKRKTQDKKSKTPGIKVEKIRPGTKVYDFTQNIDMGVFKSVYDQIEAKYRFTEKLDKDTKSKIINKGIEGMVKALEDKYTNYVEPEKADEFLESLEGEFEGIGAYVEMIEEKFTITSPIKGSPAEDAGLRPGDIVTHVDDEDVAELGTQEIIKKVRGKAGTKVKLTIQRENTGRKHITVTRGKITIPALTLEFKNGIAVVGLHQFSRDSGAKLSNMIKDEVIPAKPRGIIIDVRNNPGGFLTAAVSVGEVFLKKEQEVFRVEYKNRETVYRSNRDGELANYNNIVFLQNKGSASASEILTAMAKDYKIGKIMGQPSVGKGTVQEIVNFSNGGTLKLTVAKWLSPNKNWIDGTGVIPDVEITDPTDQEKRQDVDRQLDAAIAELLR